MRRRFTHPAQNLSQILVTQLKTLNTNRRKRGSRRRRTSALETTDYELFSGMCDPSPDGYVDSAGSRLLTLRIGGDFGC